MLSGARSAMIRAAGTMTASHGITVLIVDDHQVVREGLSAMLSAEPDLIVVGEAASGAQAIRMFSELRPDIVIMDLRLPDMNGSEAMARIGERCCTARIIVLTSLDGDAEIYRALEAGARGFLFKDMARKELVQAIRAVNEGGRYIPALVGARLAENLPRVQLTRREIEVLELMSAGLRNKEIAFRLTISEETVKAHVKRILEKLDVNDRTHAVTTALRRGIINL
jgi:two-component system NarL family response regulator